MAQFNQTLAQYRKTLKQRARMKRYTKAYIWTFFVLWTIYVLITIGTNCVEKWKSTGAKKNPEPALHETLQKNETNQLNSTAPTTLDSSSPAGSTETPQNWTSAPTGETETPVGYIESEGIWNSKWMCAAIMIMYTCQLSCILYHCFDCIRQRKRRDRSAPVDTSIIADLINSGLVSVLEAAGNVEYSTVRRLVVNTCQYNQCINIKTILKVNNANLMTIYNNKMLAMNRKKLCDELLQRPVLTEWPGLLEPQEPLRSTPTLCCCNTSQMTAHTSVEIEMAGNESETVCETPEPDARVLERHLGEHLQRDETYLFHGTLLANLKGITMNGFDVKKASKRSGYGRGIYFAESSEKADRFADNRQDRRRNDLSLIVARVLLGKVKCHTKNKRIKAPRPSADGQRSDGPDSFVIATNRSFREFLVFDERQCYPEYIVLYDRVNRNEPCV